MSVFDILKNNDLGAMLGSLMGGGNAGAAAPGNSTPAGNDLGALLGSLMDKGKAGAAALGNSTLGGLGGLLGAGTLGALLGSMLPKEVTQNAALVGAGVVAWNFYKKWAARQQQSATASQPTALTSDLQLADAGGDPTAMLLLRAMIFAARADGHIDAAEQDRISKLVPQMFPGQDSTQLINGLMNEPLNPSGLAAQVQSVEQGEDIYRLSCLIMDVDHFMERSYLDALAQSLQIGVDRRGALEQEASQARLQLANAAAV